LVWKRDILRFQGETNFSILEYEKIEYDYLPTLLPLMKIAGEAITTTQYNFSRNEKVSTSSDILTRVPTAHVREYD